MSSLSIYIPSVKSNVAGSYIEYVFRNANIGEVARVDFIPIGKKSGFKENMTGAFKSAFVHFNKFNKNFGKKLSEVKGYKFYIEDDRYWMIFQAKNPIQPTMMNNSQIVENCRHLENKVEEQALTIQNLEEKLDGVQTVVYQLLGGLFNQKSQSQVLQDHLSDLYSEPPRVVSRFEDPEEDDSEWEKWPTTRQGDANEERIQKLKKEFNELASSLNDHAEKGTAMELKVFSLEQQIKEMTNFDYIDEAVFTPYEEEDNELQDTELQARKFVPTPYPMQQLNDELFDDDTASTHSSMPDLVEASSDSDSMPGLISDSDSDSMPDLESISSAGSELCGNE